MMATPVLTSSPKPTVADYLSCMQVVMVNTTLPANIGSAARAMHTMGLTRLTVVDPKHPIDATSHAHAAGGSHLLSSARIAPTLEAAIGQCHLVFAASSRSRHLPRPVVTPTHAAQLMFQFIDHHCRPKRQANSNPPPPSDQSSNAPLANVQVGDHLTYMPDIAIVFGREDRGLTNEELACADYHIQIDANPVYPVLNVASAIQVIASFIYASAIKHVSGAPQSHPSTDGSMTTDGLSTDTYSVELSSASSSHQISTDPSPSDPKSPSTSPQTTELRVYLRQQWDEPAITHAQSEQLVARMIDLLIAQGLADSAHLRALPSRLSRLSSRLQLDQKEYQLMNALLAKLTNQ